MTTTVRDIIADAWERAGVNTDGGYSLSPRELTQALRIFQKMVLNLPGMSWWVEVDAAADYTAGENERVRVTTASAVTITVPTSVASSQRLISCCNQVTLVCTGYDDRAPKDGARIHVSDVFSDSKSTYYYRSDLAQWTAALGLTLDSEVPLSEEFDEGLAAMLALRLSAFGSVPLSDVTIQLAQRTEGKMRSRFGEKKLISVDLPLLRTSSNQIWSGN